MPTGFRHGGVIKTGRWRRWAARCRHAAAVSCPHHNKGCARLPAVTAFSYACAEHTRPPVPDSSVCARLPDPADSDVTAMHHGAQHGLMPPVRWQEALLAQAWSRDEAQERSGIEGKRTEGQRVTEEKRIRVRPTGTAAAPSAALLVEPLNSIETQKEQAQRDRAPGTDRSGSAATGPAVIYP